MAAQPYRSTSWSKEAVTNTKLAQMSSNDQWLFENMPTILYKVGGINRKEGIKIIAGRTNIPAASVYYNTVGVNFGAFFTPGCLPVVTATVESLQGFSYRMKTVTIQGTGLKSGITSEGFNITVYAEELYGAAPLTSSVAHWIAVGW